MQTAVYYPHTRPASSHVLRTALLLWDEVEFIVPWEGFQPSHVDREVAEIFEVIGRESVPSEEAKQLAHQRIEEFATQPLPDAFHFRAPNANWDASFMFARKLLPETWRMLHELNLIGTTDGRSSLLRDDTGLALMSILTDCCAGERKARITDRSDAYAKLSSFLVSGDRDIEADESPQQYVVPITMGLIEAEAVPISELIDFRRREARSGGDDLRRLRQRYRDRVEKQIRELAGVTVASDQRELQREFEIEMRDDLSDLKAELRLARREAMTNRDVIFLGIATLAAGAAASKGFHIPLEHITLAGSVPVLGGVVNAHSKYAQAKQAIIARHPMAYMLRLGG